MATAGYDPRAALDLWDLMAAVEADAAASGSPVSIEDSLSFLHTHPTSQVRQQVSSIGTGAKGEVESLVGDSAGVGAAYAECDEDLEGRPSKEAKCADQDGKDDRGDFHAAPRDRNEGERGTIASSRTADGDGGVYRLACHSAGTGDVGPENACRGVDDGCCTRTRRAVWGECASRIGV